MCKSRKDIQISPRQSSSKPSSSASLSQSNTFASDRDGDARALSVSFSSSSLSTSIRDGPTLYPFSDLSAMTPISSSSFRCTLLRTGDDVVILRRPFRSQDPDTLPSRLADLCRGHHSSIVRLLGASLAADHVYLVYRYTPGADLAACLRNPRNPGFTLLRTWLSRIQVLADVSHALEYIHHQSFTLHNRIKPSAVIVTEPGLRAKLCYFGAADHAGEVGSHNVGAGASRRSISRTNSREMKIEGTRGYMAPEILGGGRPTEKSDVYALGMLILEVVSGEEAVRYVAEGKECRVVSVAETARAASREGRVWAWMDGRLRDSYPVEVVEKVVRVGLRCVEAEAGERPDMGWVAGKVSRQLLESKAWAEKVVVPDGISVSIGPR